MNTYNFKWKSGYNRLQRAAFNKEWGRQFDMPDLVDKETTL